MTHDLILVMPVYNEEGCIGTVICDWLAELERSVGPNFQMIVVNDGSKDNTRAILDRLAGEQSKLIPIHQKNGGHGSAIVNGYRKATSFGPQYVFQVDSDNQFRPQDFSKLWAKRRESRFILGYRKIRHDALHRLLITRILRSVLFLIFGTYIPDSNIPYRLIEGDYLRRMLAALPTDLFAPNIFLSILAASDGENLMCLPVEHVDRSTGTVSIVRWRLIKVCLRSLREIVIFRASLHRRRQSLQDEASSTSSIVA